MLGSDLAAVSRPKRFILIGFAVGFAILGMVLLLRSQAAVLPLSFEAELGAIDNAATSGGGGASGSAYATLHNTSETGSNASKKLGFFPGGGDDEIDVFESFEAWLDRPGDVHFAGINHGWHAPANWEGGGFEMVANASGHWSRPANQGRDWNDRQDVTVATTLPLIPYEKGSLTDQQRVEAYNKIIAGELDSRYVQVANYMKDAHPERIIIRLGHEQEINYYPWSIRNKTPGDGYENMHELYIQAFRHIVAVFKSVSPELRFDYQGDGPWNEINDVTGKTNMESAYPGDDVVDIIGVDIYDKRSLEQNLIKLESAAAFAKARGKQFSVPEWGLWANGCGGDGPDDGAGANGDNPAYIQMMYDFLNQLPNEGPGSLAYHSYFFNNKCVSFIKNDFPQSAALFKSLFGPGTY